LQKPRGRYVVATIGCRTNQYEAEAFKHQLESLGFVQAKEDERADLCLIHTCAVTEHAEGSSRHAIRSIINRYSESRVVVTGCLAKKSADTLRSIEGVTDVVHDAEVETVVQTLFPDEPLAPFLITRFDDHTRAFVKVQDGCNHFCAYCTVPYLRGPSRSRPLSDIVEEVRVLARGGYQEIVLTGVNLGDYIDGTLSLADLVRSIDVIPEVSRLRLSSINPNEVADSLVEALASGRTTCPSLHLVAQSGSTSVLRRMGRLYTKEQYLQTVQKIRSRCPDWTFTTDVIVGFPGETDQEFADTIDLINQVRFAKVHMFPYSARPKTKAARLPDPVSVEVIRERKNRVQSLSESVAYDLRQSFVGRQMVALTERGEEGEYRFAQTLNGLPVLLPKAGCGPNQLLRVRLDSNESCALIGSIIGSCS
jgi:threonylcarbamoyladenosine tRNA methylthiotransferase MtaB